jgi:tetratricopeptide (TPR) repeat protein
MNFLPDRGILIFDSPMAAPTEVAMRRTAVFAITLAALLALATPSRAAMMEDCVQNRDWDLKVHGCTSVIDSGQYSGKKLAAFYSLRGITYHRLGEYQRAIEDYDEALRLAPNFAPIYLSRGISYRRLGEYRRAIEDYDEGLRLAPGEALAYVNRGIAYDDLGEHARAIEDYDEFLRLAPGDAAAYLQRGNAYGRLGEHRRAIEDYDEVLRLAPGDAKAYNNRANARCRLGQVEASLDDLMQALRLGAFTAEDAQRQLRDAGFYKGAIDGDFGPTSRKALRNWTAAGCPSG